MMPVFVQIYQFGLTSYEITEIHSQIYAFKFAERIQVQVIVIT